MNVYHLLQVSHRSVDDSNQRSSKITCPGDIGRIKPVMTSPIDQVGILSEWNCRAFRVV